mmetsp:Transcript_44151/g.104500  ORF Transcript_44151/g.104500 Transcript_44151/m.104500 type:complete len:201 (-) Transcript_44151:5954-6556(-)
MVTECQRFQCPHSMDVVAEGLPETGNIWIYSHFACRKDEFAVGCVNDLATALLQHASEQLQDLVHVLVDFPGQGGIVEERSRGDKPAVKPIKQVIVAVKLQAHLFELHCQIRVTILSCCQHYFQELSAIFWQCRRNLHVARGFCQPPLPQNRELSDDLLTLVCQGLNHGHKGVKATQGHLGTVVSVAHGARGVHFANHLS